MTEVEELKLKIEYLKDKIDHLELRLKNAMVFIMLQNEAIYGKTIDKSRLDT